MKKYVHDSRTWYEYFIEILNFHIKKFGALKVDVKYNGIQKPEIVLNVLNPGEETKVFPITDWLPESFKRDERDLTSDWREWVEGDSGMLVMINSILIPMGVELEKVEQK